MKCKFKGCGTILSKVANEGKTYCLIHQRIMTARDDRRIEESAYKKRLKKGIQVTDYIPVDQSLAFARENLKGKKIRIKEKLNTVGKQVHALFRYS